jgi:DNA-binding NarL/FixJ family response regulator
MRVVGQVADGNRALEVARETDPHVVLLDMRMPQLGGVAAIRRLREACPRSRILVLSMYDDPHYVRSALAAGAQAYLAKRSSSQQLLAAIRQLHSGEHPEPPELPSTAEPSELSAREREILNMVVQGQTSREMASALGITKSSVDTYRARVFRKLGVENRAALFARVQARPPVEGSELD